MDNINNDNFKEFMKKYREILSQNEDKLENIRQYRLQRYKQKKFLAVIFSLLYILLFYYLISPSLGYQNHFKGYHSISYAVFYGILILTATGFPLLYFLLTIIPRENKEYKKSVKTVFINSLLEKTGKINRISKENEHSITDKLLEYERNRNLPNWETYDMFSSVDDGFEGIYKNTKFKIAEIRPDSTKKYIQNTFAFSGKLVLSFEYSKPVKNRVYIAEHSAIRKLLFSKYGLLIIGGLAILLVMDCGNFWFFPVFMYCMLILAIIIDYPRKNTLNIGLESNKFMKRFKIDAYNEVEARYHLTPAFMERLYYMKTSFDTRDIRCVFQNGELLITMNSKRDLFEIGDINLPLDSSKNIYKFYNEITSVFKMIDYFKLDEKTGL